MFLGVPGSVVLVWGGNQCLQPLVVHKYRLFPDYWPGISPGLCSFWKSLSCIHETQWPRGGNLELLLLLACLSHPGRTAVCKSINPALCTDTDVSLRGLKWLTGQC